MKKSVFKIGGIMMAALCAAGCFRSAKPAIPADEPMRLARESAETAFNRGDYEAAVRLFGEALNRAALRDDTRATALFRYNLAACKMAQGRREESLALLEASRTESLLAGDALGAARAETAEARLALLQGNSGEAQRLARQALERAAARRDARLSADIRLVMAEAALKDGNAAQAKAELAESLRCLDAKSRGPAFRAMAARIQGLIALKEGDAAAAGRAFDDESAQWQTASRFAESADALEQAGLACEKAGNRPAAANRVYRSARIRAALGQSEKANASALRAAGWAEGPSMAELRARASALAGETAPPSKH